MGDTGLEPCAWGIFFTKGTKFCEEYNKKFNKQLNTSLIPLIYYKVKSIINNCWGGTVNNLIIYKFISCTYLF